MDNAAVWVIVGIAAIIVIALLAYVALKTRNRNRQVHADRIREEVDEDSPRVKRREALADETEAKARATQADAEAKAAEAARLADTAATRRDAAATSRKDLDDRRDHADALDPRSTTNDRREA